MIDIILLAESDLQYRRFPSKRRFSIVDLNIFFWRIRLVPYAQ